MGNNNHEPYEVNRFIEAPSSFQSTPQRQRQSLKVVGLTPTDGAGHDAYKRSTNSKSSRRSRSERISYLVATGHLDIEETRQLAEPTRQSVAPNSSKNDLQLLSKNKNKIPAQPAGGDQELIDYANQYNTDIINFDKNNIFSHDTKKSKSISSQNYSKNYNNGIKLNDHSSTGNFENRTFTEVTLPMKTSPAFEYLLQDDKRRNKRCCLWLLYFTLITICLVVVVYCSVQVINRQQHFIY